VGFPDFSEIFGQIGPLAEKYASVMEGPRDQVSENCPATPNEVF
jgi:hypothetical protein